MINYEVALGQFELFVLILIRLASFVYAAPFFNTANVPRKFKVGFAIALSVIVYAIHPDMSVEYDNMIDYCIIALQEVIVFSRLLCDWFVRENTNPHLTLTLHITSYRDTSSFDLTTGNPFIF